MIEEYRNVADFQKKHGFPNGKKMFVPSSATALRLKMIGHGLESAGTELRHEQSIARTRCGLILEEVGELFDAMGNGDEVGTLDALADIIYTALGCAATYDLPIVEAFREVHTSNMTKQTKRPDETNVSFKGPDYKEPNLKMVLQIYRDRK